MFGLDVDTLRKLRETFARFPRIQKVLLYGSRAKGNYKAGSDIDITLIGKRLSLRGTIYPLMAALDELYLPYTFDISIFNQLKDFDFIDHILRVGKTFYRKENMAMGKWPIFPLKGLCQFSNGLWKGKKPPYIHVGVIRNTNFTKSGFLDDNDIAYLDVEEKQFAKRQLQFGDLILEKSGGGPKQPVGRVITFEKDEGLFSFSNFTSIIRVVDPSKLSFYFLHRLLYWYYISGATEGMQRRSTGIRNLDFSAYKRLPVPLPTLPEQKQIIGILDEAFAAIATANANIKKSLANTQELFESELNRIFHSHESAGKQGGALADEWMCLKLGEALRLEYGKPLPTERRITDGMFPVYGANGVKCYTDDVYWEKPSIIVGRKGSAGKLNLTDGKFWPLDVTYFVVFDENKHDLRFLYYLLSWLDLPSLANGVKPGLNRNDVYAIKQHFPTLPKQRQIVMFLDKVSVKQQALISIYETKSVVLSELKQSLLHMAFTGELTADSKAANLRLSEAGI